MTQQNSVSHTPQSTDLSGGSVKSADAFRRVVVAATKGSLEQLEKEVAAAFAYAFWYANDATSKAIEDRLKDPTVARVRKRRLMYLVDRLRRFPCMEPEQASRMKDFVACWSDLSHSASQKVVERAAKVNPYDKLAVTWGLDENVSNVMSMVLEFQTRHFVDEHHLPSGYTKLKNDKRERVAN
ncbi:hypothetical protein [Pseudomonas sp. NPDC008258]|uniref:hypothetical protein n=1 Tax=Pseudomonas sp. NPDC008258 TaxID=3364418 RepID=UPI0036EB2954